MTETAVVALIQQGALASTTGTATTTPQINNLISRVRKISVLHVWHAIMNKSVPSSAKQQREITMFTVLMTTWAYNCTALILCI